MRILVTGGAGFIGSHLVAHFHKNAAVRVLDNLRTGRRENLTGLRHEFMEGSILDAAMLERAMDGVDYVFHLAALVSVPESIEQIHECVAHNVTGTINVLEAAERAGVKKVCFSSSSAIYGNDPETPKREDMMPAPRSPYALTKLDGEFYCRIFTESGRVPTVSLRFFNVFGPRQDPRGSYAAAVPVFLENALAGNPLTIHGDGGQTRDFIFVKDVVAALAFAATTPGVTGVFNAGYGVETTILDLARRIVALTGSSSPIRHGPVRPGDVRSSCASVEKLRAAGFHPKGTLDAGLSETIASLKHVPAVPH